MLRVKTPILAFVGLLVVGIVALQLVQGAIDIPTASLRVLVVAVSLAAVEKLALPLARTLVSSGSRPD